MNAKREFGVASLKQVFYCKIIVLLQTSSQDLVHSMLLIVSFLLATLLLHISRQCPNERRRKIGIIQVISLKLYMLIGRLQLESFEPLSMQKRAIGFHTDLLPSSGFVGRKTVEAVPRVSVDKYLNENLTPRYALLILSPRLVLHSSSAQ